MFLALKDVPGTPGALSGHLQGVPGTLQQVPGSSFGEPGRPGRVPEPILDAGGNALGSISAGFWTPFPKKFV